MVAVGREGRGGGGGAVLECHRVALTKGYRVSNRKLVVKLSTGSVN